MKIDYVITGIDIGGAEIQVIDLLIELTKRGHFVRLISVTPPVSLVDRLQENNISVISLNMTRKIDLITSIFKLRTIIKLNCTDIIHSHMFHANILVRIMNVFYKKKPIICTAHSTYEGGKLRDMVYRLTNTLSDLNTVVSDAAKKRYIRDTVFPKENTRTVFNCINTDFFTCEDKPSDPTFHWITVGRLVPLKNHLSIIKALEYLPNSDLTIVGDGSELVNLKEYVKKQGLSGRVNFTGSRSNLPDFYNKSNAFVLASKYEGFSLAIAEAMSCGLMVVSTDCGGPSDIIGKDSNVGRLVPIGSEYELLSAMKEIENMKRSDREYFGKSARNIITSRFSIDKIVSEWESIYFKLM